MYKKRNKILLAMDGSDQAMDAARYIGAVFSKNNTDIVLFNVDPKIPESLMDMGGKPEFNYMLRSTRSWSVEYRKKVEGFMDTAHTILVNAGFPAQAIKITIQPKKSGITRDIVRESYEDYNAVVVGRTGVSRLKDILIGSVATKLLGKIHDVPLIVVGGTPSTEKILIAFDGSEGSMKSVTRAGALLDASQTSVLLCHVIRSMNVPQINTEHAINSDFIEQWVDESKNRITSSFNHAKEILVQSGFDPSFVSTRILTDRMSRASSVVSEAKKGGYDTIVVGRRGLSVVEEFFLGRVSKKVFQLANDRAVMIVS